MADLAALQVSLELQTAAFQAGVKQVDSQLRRMERNVNQTSGSFKRMESTFDSLKKGAIALGAAFAAFKGAKSFIDAADKVDGLSGSFKALLGDSERAGDMLSRVFAVVGRTGADLNDVAEATQRLAIGMSEMGASNAQISLVAENFIKLGRVGGSSMSDINGALLQFTQALSSGRLQGDELRSIMERVPLAIQLIAKEMGVTTGEVRKLGSEGKITADILANAFLGATDDINAQFAELPITFEQSVNKLGAKWTQFQASITKNSGFAKGINAIIDSIANNFQAAANFIARLVYETQMAILNLSYAAVQGADLMSKPFRLLFEKIAEFTGSETATKLADVFTAPAEALKFLALAGEEAQRQLDANIKAFEAIGDAGEEAGEQIKTLSASVTSSVDATVIAKYQRLADRFRDAADPARALSEHLATLNKLLEDGSLDWETYTDAVFAVQDAFDKATASTKTAGEDIKSLSEEIKDAINGFSRDFTNNLVDGLAEGKLAFKDFAKDVLATIAKIVLNKQFESLFSMIAGGLGGGGGFLGGLFGGGGTTRAFIPAGATTREGTSHVGRIASPSYGALGGGAGRSGGGSGVNITVNNNSNAKVDVQQKQGANGMEIEFMIEEAVGRQMGSGAYDKVMQSRFGVNRRGY